MLAARASSTEMQFIVYIRLLDEGTTVFRPVPAVRVSDTECVLQGEDIFDANSESWEFLPGTRVRYELKRIDDALLPVGVGLAGAR